MSTVAETPALLTAQYEILQASVALPTPRELFDFQVWTLHDKGLDLPNKSVDRLHTFVPQQPQLFLVIPRQPDILDLAGLVTLIRNNKRRGYGYGKVNLNFNSHTLTDVIETPKEAHLLLGIEDGRKHKHKSPNDSIRIFQDENRLGYTTWYGLVHGIVFSDLLYSHCLDLVGSRYRSKFVPSLRTYLETSDCSHHTIPWLDVSNIDGISPGWGAPSAREAVGME